MSRIPVGFLGLMPRFTRLKPRKVIEVGSGFSAARLFDAADNYLPGLEVVCVEPYPQRLLSPLRPEDRVEVIESPVQETPVSLFTSLQPRAILFIDSSHVAKAGSDVVRLVRNIFPRLQQGVFVRFHDIFWPFEYPASWSHRSFNEAYFLEAFLSDNSKFQIELFNPWTWEKHRDLIPPRLRTPSSPRSILAQQSVRFASARTFDAFPALNCTCSIVTLTGRRKESC